MRPTIAGGTLAVLLLLPHAVLGWPAGDTTGIALQFQSLTRHYDVHVPASYDGSTPVPLVLDFHGWTSDPAAQRSLSGFNALSDSVGFIVAYPEGYDPNGSQRSWNAGICCDPARAAGLDDVALARAIVADVQGQASIDPARIYATGLSNGGAMAHRIACAAADLFAAASSIACPLLIEPFGDCQPVRPVPILHFAGLTDQVVPYNGGQSQVFPQLILPSSPGSFAYWSQTDGCGNGPPEVVEDLGNGASCQTHTACAAGAQVGFCSIHGTLYFGHVIYSNSDGLNVAQRAWSFMSQFTLPGGITTTTTTGNSTSTTSTSTTTSTTLRSANRCAGAKLKATGKDAACLLRVGSNAAAGGTENPAAVQACRDKLGASFTKAEATPPCPTSGDAPAIESAIGVFVGSVDAALAPAPPATSRCGAAKLKAAGKKAKCLLALEAKRVTKGIAAPMEKIQACETKMLTAFGKAEGSGDCVATGDAGAIAQQVDQLASDMLCQLAGVCP